MDTFGNDVERKFFSSLNISTDRGRYADQQKAMVTLGASDQTLAKTDGSTASITRQWGAKFQMDDCDTYRCASDLLFSYRMIFGGWLEIPVELSRKL